MSKIPEFVLGDEGVFYDMPDPDYRKAPGVSNSMIKHVALDGDEPGSPAHFLQQFLDPSTDSDAMFCGRAVHGRILTPDAPLEGFVAIPEDYPAPDDHALVKANKIAPGDPLKWTGNAKYCKAWLAEQEKKGLQPLKQDGTNSISMMEGIINAIAKHPVCQVAFAEGKPEVSLFKRYQRENGTVLRKARLDWVSPGPALVDIKTCLDARACEFDSVLWKRRYFCQAAYYMDLFNELNPNDQKTNFVFIAVEKFAPYNIQIFDVDESTIDEGRREYRRNLALIIQCIREGNWPGYPQEIQKIKMRTPYRVKRLENEA